MVYNLKMQIEMQLYSCTKNSMRCNFVISYYYIPLNASTNCSYDL